VSDHIYEAGQTKTTGAAAGPIVTILPGTLGAGIRAPEIREIGVFNVSGVAGEIGTGIPAAAGTGGASASETVQALNQLDPAGHTTLITSFTTLQPTAPGNPYRRAEVQAVVGAGVIWTWAPGEWILWSGATIPQVVVWQFSSLAVTYDVYIKVAE
jgi:hypothetical protein